jgi:hypothetical protein
VKSTALSDETKNVTTISGVILIFFLLILTDHPCDLYLLISAGVDIGVDNIMLGNRCCTIFSFAFGADVGIGVDDVMFGDWPCV